MKAARRMDWQAVEFDCDQRRSTGFATRTSGVSARKRLTHPTALLALIPALDEWGDRRAFRIASAVLLAASVFSATFPHNNPWQQPWIKNVIEKAK